MLREITKDTHDQLAQLLATLGLDENQAKCFLTRFSGDNGILMADLTEQNCLSYAIVDLLRETPTITKVAGLSPETCMTIIDACVEKLKDRWSDEVILLVEQDAGRLGQLLIQNGWEHDSPTTYRKVVNK